MSVAVALAILASAGLVVFAGRALADARLRATNRFVLFMHKGGLGDAFCQTALMRALLAKNPALRFIVNTRYPDFFRNLPEVARIVDLSGHGAFARWCIHAPLRLLRLRHSHNFVYKPQRQVPKTWCDAHPDQRPHLVELAAERLKLPADFSVVRGHIVFSDEENRAFAAKHAALGDDFALVVPSGKTSYTPNKEWGFDRYAAVVAALPQVRWVQLGLADQPALPGVTDLRGATGLREMAWLIAHAKFLLCGEGLHNHLAGATGTTTFVVYSGFHYTGIAAHPTMIPVVAAPMPACAPCWLKSPCPVPGKPCTTDISPEQVIKVIQERLPALPKKY